MVSFARQVRLLLGKTAKESARHPLLCVCQVLLPVAFMSLTSVLIHAGNVVYYNDSAQAVMDESMTLPIPAYSFPACNASQGSSVATQFALVGPASVRQDFERFLAKQPSPPPPHCLRHFDTDAELDDYVSAGDYLSKTQVSLAISFDGPRRAGLPFRYRIRGNATQTLDGSGSANVPTTRFPTSTTERRQDASYVGSFAKTFLPLQLLVDQYAMKTTSPISGPGTGMGVFLRLFPQFAFSSNNVYGIVSNFFSLFFIILLCTPLAMQVRGMVGERERKIREGLLIFGVHEMAPVASWFAMYGLVWLAIAAGCVLSTSAFFANSSSGLIFLLFLLYGFSVVQFAYFLQAFFDRSRSGSSLGSLIFVATFFPYYTVRSHSAAIQVLCSLFPNTAFGLILRKAVEFESDGIGLTSATIGIVNDNTTAQQLLLLLLLDCGIYFVLGYYIERVWPHAYGTRYPLFFFLDASFWGCGRNRDGNVSSTGHFELRNVDAGALQSTPAMHELDPSSFEAPGAENDAKDEQDKCIRVTKLRKEFGTPDGTKIAVDDLSLTLYEGQIFALLGHNGAGKTTTISMLSGMLSPSGGHAAMYGQDLAQDMTSIRRTLGVCPQHDVLFDDLTVEEHLYLYARLKDIPEDELQSTVSSAIADVGITAKAQQRSKTLSGGQKRKLSVAIALMGNSRVVFLDEPTSGMDPYSRRSTWNLIQQKREGRIIILTTHFMDEADLLGDRIGIMADGKMRCCGSAMFLKKQFGVGYNLTMIKTADCDADAVKQLVQSHVPAAQLLSNVGSEIAFQLPLGATSAFPHMLQAIEEQQRQVGIDDYGLSVTTMEEVFLRVAEGGDKQEIEMTRNLSKRLSQSRDMAPSTGAGAGPGSLTELQSPTMDADLGPSTAADAEFDVSTIPDANVTSMFFTHFVALFVKRARYARRDFKMALFQVVIPVLGVLAVMLLLKASKLGDQPALPIDATTLNPDGGRYQHTTLMPVVAASTSVARSFVGAFGHETGRAVPAVFDVSNITDKSTCDLINAPFEANDKASQYRLPASRTPAPFPNKTYCDEQVKEDKYIAGTLQDKLLRLRSQLTIYDVQLKQRTATAVLHVNSTSNLAAPLALNTFTNMLIDSLRKNGHKDLPSSVHVTNHPLPVTASVRAAVGNLFALFASLLLVVVFAFIPAAQAIFVVKERETNVKHQQLISGVSIPAYWLSTFAWDLCNYAIPFASTLLLFKIFNLKQFLKSDVIGSVVALLAGYGASTAAFTYATSFAFRSHTAALSVVLLLNLLMLLLVMASNVMTQLESTCHVISTLNYGFALLPGYNLGYGLLQLALFDNGVKVDCKPEVDLSAGDWVVSGLYITFLFATAGLYLAMAIGIDFVLSTPWIRRAIIPEPTPRITPCRKDADVAEEEARVRHGGADNDVVCVDGLHKVYRGGKVAVQELSFGIPRGEVFGFLGINGAGKTTTLKILSGDQVPTQGGARLAGMDIMSQQVEVRRLLGYCPQFSALLELLTVREHLELFARIKGFRSDVVPRLVAAKIREMDLSDFEHKQAGSLSGGNQRKLSVAIATIGNPRILFLDEPSTGVDPVSRRFMWSVISRMVAERKECSAILTSHSMEEVQALCTRVGIMVGGRLRCLGSIQHLKGKFGHGLMTEIKLHEPQEDALDHLISVGRDAAGGDLVTPTTLDRVCEAMGDGTRRSAFAPNGSAWLLDAGMKRSGEIGVDQVAGWWAEESMAHNLTDWITTTFHGSLLLERHGQYLRFRIMPGKRSLSQVFSIIERAKAELHVREYSLSQTSLEQIFNMFASQQEEETGAVAGMAQLDAMMSETPTPSPTPHADA